MSNPLIYVAGPLFSDHERSYKKKIVNVVSKETGLDPQEDFFLPYRDAGDVDVNTTKTEAFNVDIKILEESKIIIALLDGPDVDSGTAVELGYAFKMDKKIFGLLTDFRAYREEEVTTNNMIWGICERGDTIYRELSKLAVNVKRYLEKNEII